MFSRSRPRNQSLVSPIDTSGSPASTSTSTAHPTPFVPAIAATESLQAVQTDDGTTARRRSIPVSYLAPTRLEEESPVQTDPQNVLITGGNFVNCRDYTFHSPTLSPKMQMQIPILQRPNPSPLFTGRKDVLDKLKKIFVRRANSKLMSRRSCLLWGLGGIGKTQICLKFTEEMSENSSFSHVFWVDAFSHESITMSLKGISSSPAAQASGVDDSVQAVLNWISTIQEEWLIVFDNADHFSPEGLAKFFPPGNRGNILITSRDQSMGRVISLANCCIEINEMEEADAITLLLKASCLDALAEHQQAAKEIVAELGCIPLAVNHAGAYIQAGRCDINIYLRQLSLHHQMLLSDTTFTGASNYDQTVYGTWDLSFKEIEKRAGGGSNTGNAQAAQAAILILQICAFCHYNNISKAIFRSAAEGSKKRKVANKLPHAATLLDHNLLALDSDGQWDEFTFGQGISVLLSFSLIKRGNSSEMFSIHSLVHQWCREQMSNSEQQRMFQMASIILSCAIPRRSTSQDYALRQLIFPHIKANELHGSQMRLIKQYYDDKHTNFALVMEENGDWDSAEQLRVEVMDMRKKKLGVKHPHTLTSMGELATTYHNQGRYNEAEQLEVQVRDKRKKLLGAKHPHTLTSMGNMASTYRTQGRWNEAEKLELQVMDLMKTLLGAEHPDTLTSMGNLAYTYWNQGRWKEAEQLEVQVMDKRKKLLGAEHPHTLLSMGNLANTYLNQGRWNEAEKLQVQVMHMRKKLLGPEHLDTLLSMENLASTYYNQGDWNEAEQLQVQVMEIRKKQLGANHLRTLSSMAHLAITYVNQGKWNKAEQLQIQVVDMRKKLLGAEHPDTLASMGNIARTYCTQGRWNEAEKLEIQVMAARKKLLGAKHPDTLTSMSNLASTYYNKGRWSEAEKLQVQVMHMRKELIGAKHPDTLTSMGNLASTYRNQGRCNDAEELEVQVMDMRKNMLGAEHPYTFLSMANLASTYYHQKRWNEAEELQVQVMAMRKKLLGAAHPDTLTSMASLASTYHNQGRWNEAEQLQAQVMHIRKELIGAEHPDTLTSMTNLARMYHSMGRWDEAKQLGIQVLDVWKKIGKHEV